MLKRRRKNLRPLDVQRAPAIEPPTEATAVTLRAPVRARRETRREMTSATVSMCSTSAAAPRVAADGRRRATAGASRRRHHVACPETGNARAAGTGWTGRETRWVERRPSPSMGGDRGVVSRALLGDQEVRPDPTRPTARRVRIPEKSPIVSPRFSLEIRRARRAAADGRGAPPVLARVPQRARSRADRRSREPSRSANSRGGTRASAPPNAGGRRRPPRSSRRSPGKPGSRLVVLDAWQTKHRVFRTS